MKNCCDHMAELKKIQEYVEQHNIKPSDCLYHTQRSVKNKKGQMAGKIRVLVTKSDGRARAEYICPECGNYGYVEAEWKRPFSVRCEKCQAKIGVPKMKNEAKRQLKGQ